MIILSKRRLTFLCIVMILTMFIYTGVKIDGKTIEAGALPVSNKTIIIDAGHGTPDERCGKQEWNF